MIRLSRIKKVAVYSRKSRPDETDEMLQRQLSMLIEMCVKNDWTFEVFSEVGSSQDINRPELNKMLAKVQTYEYDAIVITDQDRLSRNTGGFGQIKEILTNYGVQVVTTSKVYDYSTQEDDMMSDMMSVVAKQEYLNIKKRLVRGKRQSAKDGNWVGGKTPVGYNYDHKSKKLQLNEYAPIIQRIFALYLSGKTSTDIERIFELEGVLTPSGSSWNKARISVVLANPVYKGTVIFGKTKVSKTSKKPSGAPRQFKTEATEQIVIENAHEPIVSIEDWETARDIRESRLTKAPSSRIGKVNFTGLIRCALCNRTHSFQRRKGKELRITSCQTRIYADDGTYTVCANKGVKLELFEKVFYASFSQYVDKLEQYLEDVKANMKMDDSNPADEKAILTSAIKKIDQQIKKVQQGFLAEVYTEEEAQKEIKQLKAHRQQSETQLERLDTVSKDDQIDKLQNTLNRLKEILTGTTKMETKEVNHLLTSLIDHIEYKRIGDHKAGIEIKIHYKG
ncbi:recombinase family protein [Paenibacillus mangrovi]|uniref:recombinase family protein n=1 Tax=Paenibacillus mangrovi TaxID=2931978 RepID=UPI003CC7C838